MGIVEIFTINKVYGTVFEIMRFQDENANDYKLYELIVDAIWGVSMVCGSQDDFKEGT